MDGENTLMKESCTVLRGHVVGRDKVYHLCETVSDREHVAERLAVERTFAQWQVDNVVHGNLVPCVLRHCVRCKGASLLQPRGVGSSAGVTVA